MEGVMQTVDGADENTKKASLRHEEVAGGPPL